MTAPQPTPAPNGDPQAVPDPPAAPNPAPEPPAAPSDPAPKPTKRSLEDSLAPLDDDTRQFVLGEVAKARREAGDARGTARKQAAEQARTELAEAIGKAIGLVPDEGGEPPDPAVLTDQLTAQTAAARTAQVELAVYRAALALEGNASALLDSRSFMSSLAELDPADGDAVNNAVQAALAANPTLKTAPARRAPGPLATPGGSTPVQLDDQIAAAKKAGDVRLWMRLENQKLAAPSR